MDTGFVRRVIFVSTTSGWQSSYRMHRLKKDTQVKRLEDYGIIGNMHTAALVGRDGSIDWLCVPRFDSGACFAALLGNSENGRWQIAPRESRFRVSRQYRGASAIIETKFETKLGVVSILDFMPPSDNDFKIEIVRIVHGERGAVAMEMELYSDLTMANRFHGYAVEITA